MAHKPGVRLADAPSPTPIAFAPFLQRPDAELVARFGALRSRQDVADLLEISDAYLKIILYFRKEPSRYRSFSIRKRRGGHRTISAPPLALRILQAKLNHVLQLVYKRKVPVHGFLRGYGILSNAKEHVGKRWVLNIDLKNYFPSINFGRVRGALMAQPYAVGPSAATVIAQIACADNSLPQGAPSSPMLANMVSARLDGELLALARRYGCIYTRYADDITLSTRTPSFPAELAAPVSGFVGASVGLGAALTKVVESNGFFINPEKTRLQFRDCHQEVTGLTVNLFPNLSRDYIREIRAMLHSWRMAGLEAAESQYNERFNRRAIGGQRVQSSLRYALRGRIEYVAAIKGSRDPVYCKLRNMLHSLDDALIAPAPVPQPRPLPSPLPSGTIPWDRFYHAYANRVFLLELRRSNGDIRSGTAFALRDGHVATAAHLLHGRVSLYGDWGSAQVTEAIVHPDHARGLDCALIPFGHVVAGFEVARRIPMPGQEIAVIGFARVPQRQNALGLYAGYVEALSTDYNRSVSYVQISVPSAGGLSGSPVIDRRGRLIGIVVKSAFEQTGPDVPGREFCTVLPIGYVVALDTMCPLTPLPLSEEAAEQAPEADEPG